LEETHPKGNLNTGAGSGPRAAATRVPRSDRRSLSTRSPTFRTFLPTSRARTDPGRRLRFGTGTNTRAAAAAAGPGPGQAAARGGLSPALGSYTGRALPPGSGPKGAALTATARGPPLPGRCGCRRRSSQPAPAKAGPARQGGELPALANPAPHLGPGSALSQ